MRAASSLSLPLNYGFIIRPRSQNHRETADPAPGAHNPHVFRDMSRDLASGPSSSFARSDRSGAGSFGAIGDRDRKGWPAVHGEDGPGPGAYRSSEQTNTFGRELFAKRQAAMPNAAFRSSSAQRPKVQSYTGSTGTYEPRYSAVKAAPRNGGGAALRATEKRFLKLETTGEGVSPSAYDTPDLLPNGGRGATMAGRQALRTESGGASAAFRSDSVREFGFTTQAW